MDKSEVTWCSNRYCRKPFNTNSHVDNKNLCSTCHHYYRITGDKRRLNGRKTTVCSNPTCFSLVPLKCLRQDPLSKRWICRPCHSRIRDLKPIRQIDSKSFHQCSPTESKTSPPAENTVTPAKVLEQSEYQIPFEIYQEALKVYEELQKVTPDVPKLQVEEAHTM